LRILILQVAKVATRTTIPLRTLALALSLTILPIAFVYNLAHYFTLILVRTRYFRTCSPTHSDSNGIH